MIEAPQLPLDPSIAIVTLSFKGDFELCRILCETMDEYVPDIQHFVVVPRGDLQLFSSVANGRRRLVAEDELLPGWLRKLPMPGPEWRRRLRLPRRNIYLTPQLRFVRGWIAQQIMKIVAAVSLGPDIILHVDSDVAFVRPLKKDRFLQNGKVPLLKMPKAGDDAMHWPWHESASRLLGLEACQYFGDDYIGNLIVWRRDCAKALLDRIESVVHRDPLKYLAGTAQFSEYILYGVFCSHVLGMDESGHYGSSETLCKTIWSSDGSIDADDLQLEANQIAVGIQSTIPVPLATRRQLLAKVSEALKI